MNLDATLAPTATLDFQVAVVVTGLQEDVKTPNWYEIGGMVHFPVESR